MGPLGFGVLFGSADLEAIQGGCLGVRTRWVQRSEHRISVSHRALSASPEAWDSATAVPDPALARPRPPSATWGNPAECPHPSDQRLSAAIPAAGPRATAPSPDMSTRPLLARPSAPSDQTAVGFLEGPCPPAVTNFPAVPWCRPRSGNSMPIVPSC